MSPGQGRRIWLDEVDSTNTYLRHHPQPHGTVVVARRQTHGRGRQGRQWHSVEGESLTFSLALRPDGERQHWSRLGLAAGLGLCEALEAMGYTPRIKWPNDLLIGAQKLAGILVEVIDDAAVVGIGLNLNQMEFPGEIDAVSLRLADGREWRPEEALDRVLPALQKRCEEVGGDLEPMLDAIRRRCALTGMTVRLKSSGKSLSGRVLGLGPGGELRLEVDGDERRIHQAEEIRAIHDEAF
jgi:biotin-[acetyl-CoA-carboxylase] ligase BirA-like protein